MSDIFKTDPLLSPPFDTWPRWAVDLDVELSDLQGDVCLDDSDEGKKATATIDRMRAVLAEAMAKSV